ncbi:MAG TPA: hypothetical protein VMT93_08685 [Gemmatimonadaceae bacterium]|nr:hypothetical protein [Gemmatimonadaceae bacterium]
MTDVSWVNTYRTSASEIGWGSALTALTMVMHTYAMLGTLWVADAYEHLGEQRGILRRGIGVLLIASMLIVAAHALEVIAWAGFFSWKDCFPSLSTSYYYALLQYTTVGSELDLPDRWRLLGGMIAIAGLLTFAWSTTVLLTIAQKVQDAVLARGNARRKARRDGAAG